MFRARLVVAVLVALASESTLPSQEKPPYERLLQGADAAKAAELDRQIDDSMKADRFPDAIRLATELLELRTQKQGAEHYETVIARWEVATLRKVAALPAGQRAAWNAALLGVQEAKQLEARGR